MTTIDHLLKLRQARQDAEDTLKARYSFEARIAYDNAARAAELEAEVSKLRGAISWIEPPFVDATTSHDELKKRVGCCVADAKRAAIRAIGAP